MRCFTRVNRWLTQFSVWDRKITRQSRPMEYIQLTKPLFLFSLSLCAHAHNYKVTCDLMNSFLTLYIFVFVACLFLKNECSWTGSNELAWTVFDKLYISREIPILVYIYYCLYWRCSFTWVKFQTISILVYVYYCLNWWCSFTWAKFQTISILVYVYYCLYSRCSFTWVKLETGVEFWMRKGVLYWWCFFILGWPFLQLTGRLNQMSNYLTWSGVFFGLPSHA